MSEDPLLEPPTILERLLGAIALPIGLGATVGLILFALLYGFRRHIYFYNRYNDYSYYVILALAAIVAVSMVAGFMIGIGRSLLALTYLWGTADKKDAKKTSAIWLTVLVVGVVGIVCLRPFIKP